jgi:hypothetical protein
MGMQKSKIRFDFRFLLFSIRFDSIRVLFQWLWLVSSWVDWHFVYGCSSCVCWWVCDAIDVRLHGIPKKGLFVLNVISFEWLITRTTISEISVLMCWCVDCWCVDVSKTMWLKESRVRTFFKWKRNFIHLCLTTLNTIYYIYCRQRRMSSSYQHGMKELSSSAKREVSALLESIHNDQQI